MNKLCIGAPQRSQPESSILSGQRHVTNTLRKLNTGALQLCDPTDGILPN
jgi:hypothetical protein